MSAPLLTRITANGDTRIAVDTVYALPDHPNNHFGAVYVPDAVCYAHPLLTDIVHTAASYLPDNQRLCVKDGLRTPDAQRLMADVKTQRQWPDDLLSAPGEGAHPRACAVDVMTEYRNDEGEYVEADAGCHFDDFSMLHPESGQILPEGERGIPAAHRDNPFISDDAYQVRCALECAMMRAALAHHTLILPLPCEYWDFRFPFSENDLGDVMQSICRLCGISAHHYTIRNYDDFVMAWYALFESDERRRLLEETLCVSEPPLREAIIYAGQQPLWTDADLRKHGYTPLTALHGL